MEENKKIIACWSISLIVDCPFCDEWGIDVLKDPDVHQIAMEQLCGKGASKCVDIEVECPKCKKNFKIDETEY